MQESGGVQPLSLVLRINPAMEQQMDGRVFLNMV